MKSVIAVCGVACIAAAEPVVVRLPEIVPSQFNLRSFDGRFPPASLSHYWWGGGPSNLTYHIPRLILENESCTQLQVAPGETFFRPDNSGRPYTERVAGVEVGPASGLTWGPADLRCTAPDSFDYGALWSPLLSASYKFACDLDCPQTDLWRGLEPYEPIADGVYYIPIRYAGKEGEAFQYGWIAFRLTTDILHEECAMDLEPLCPLEEAKYDNYTYIGIAIETDAGVPIVLGAGLCEADLSPDGVLDLTDIQAFTQGFIALDPVADLTGDGVFDLADVQAFISAFTTGCGIL